MPAWSMADWAFEPGVLIGLAGLIGAYAVSARRLRPATVWNENVLSIGEVVAFASGVLLIFIALVTPLDTLSDQMFSAHMLQHMLLLYVVPPLLIVGTPAWILRPLLDHPRIRPIAQLIVHPIVAFVIFNMALVVWHLPFFWQMALVDPQAHALEHLTFLGAGIVAWWPVFSPLPDLGRLSYPVQCLYLFAQSLVPAVIGAFITFSGIVVYPVYTETPKLWGLSPLADQQIAGLLMKMLGTVFLWVLVSVRFFQWFHQEEHEDEKYLDDGTPRSSLR